MPSPSPHSKMERSSSNHWQSTGDGKESVDYCWECHTWVACVVLRKWRAMAGKARAMVGKFPDSLYFVPNHVGSFRYVLHLPDCLFLVQNHVYSFRYVLNFPDCLYLVSNPVWWEKRRRWWESFLTVCTLFQNMLTSLDTSYTFLTVCTWFQITSTPLDTPYTFLTVRTWFQTLSTPLDTSYTFHGANF